MLEVEDLSGEIGFNFFVVGIEPDSDKLDFLAKGLELAILLDSVVLPDGIRNSLDQKLAKIVEDVEESERYDIALNRIKALLNEVQTQADQFEEEVLADALVLIRAMSLTGATILNPQVKKSPKRLLPLSGKASISQSLWESTLMTCTSFLT